MSYNRKNPKILISEFCSSNEFKSFKDSLEEFSVSLEGDNINELVKSLNRIGKSKDEMVKRVNSMLKYTIDGYLTEAQIQEVEMESDEDGVALSYKHYIPIYISEERTYTSVDSRLLVIDFENKRICVKDLFKVFDKASKCSKADRIKKEASLEEDIQRINDMERNRDNSAYVVNKVNKYNKDAIRSKTFEKIKCLISKNAYAEYLAAFDDILDELKDDVYFKKEELKKDKPYDYEGKYTELYDLQKGLIRRLMDLNFQMDYENMNDAMTIVKKPINIKNLYRM